MSEIPAEAVRALAEALHGEVCAGTAACATVIGASHFERARTLLASVAPLIAAAERERIRQGLAELGRKRPPFIYFGHDIAAVLDGGES